MVTFSWTIDYVLSLPFPVFMRLSGMISDIRRDNAIDSVYIPYAAAKYGGECHKNLFKQNHFVITEEIELENYNDDDLKFAKKRMQQLQK